VAPVYLIQRADILVGELQVLKVVRLCAGEAALHLVLVHQRQPHVPANR
jgi:hypothetical protein